EVDQQIEDLRLDSNRFPATAKLAGLVVKRMIAKEKLHAGAPTAVKTKSQEIIKPASRTNQAPGKVLRAHVLYSHPNHVGNWTGAFYAHRIARCNPFCQAGTGACIA